jgi:hypothetical protein
MILPPQLIGVLLVIRLLAGAVRGGVRTADSTGMSATNVTADAEGATVAALSSGQQALAAGDTKPPCNTSPPCNSFF